MKRLFIGIFAISIALVSCNKETVVPSANSDNGIHKTLVQQDYTLNGVTGDLYKTDNGQMLLMVKPGGLKSNITWTGTLTTVSNSAETYETCRGSATNCTYIHIGETKYMLVKVKDNGKVDE